MVCVVALEGSYEESHAGTTYMNPKYAGDEDSAKLSYATIFSWGGAVVALGIGLTGLGAGMSAWYRSRLVSANVGKLPSSTLQDTTSYRADHNGV